MHSQPNILFIQADQLAASILPFYGHPLVKTPHLDRLAAMGTVFENAYTPNPICASSRFAMMSGQYSTRIGAFDNASEFPASVPTFAHYLRSLGYATCLAGKMHFVGPDQLHGFEERVTTDIYPSDFGWTANWEQKIEPYAPSQMSMRGVVESGLCIRSLQMDYDDDVANQSVQWLFDHARRDYDKPFALVASFTHPHNPFTISQEFWDLYDDADIDMPSVPHVPFEQRDAWSQRYFKLIRQDEHHVTEAHIRSARHAYFGMVSYLDSKVGILLDTLEKINAIDNTIIVFTADHGEMLGERGMWYKFNPYQNAIRVPLLICAPGAKKGHRVSANCSLVDMLPTLLDLATHNNSPKLVDHCDGRSLYAWLHGTDPSWKDEALIEFTSEGVHAPAFILRKGNYKYVYCEGDPGMLFDMQKDPMELQNLCQAPEFSKLAQQFVSEIETRFNPSKVKSNVMESQRRRLFLHSTLLKGHHTSWDYQVHKDASKQYVRSSATTSTTATKAKARYPFVPTSAPDTPRKPNL
ncbi:choline-sulfatase [Limnohabitans sp. 2KL-27]|uniref:choline-sulfatase n=1 Tax=Limnohabitans sp. 2KL-27 TaxID=1100705 RepID=UPI000B0E06A3|nr:choline-sulfatase [Limnohabitans sp. 2KL-27]